MSWLSDYLAYTADQESPEDFHLWTGLTIIAATLGRNTWLDRRSQGVTRYRIYPGQLMTVLVGGSAQTKKTTASDFAIRFLDGLDISIIRKVTPEKLLRRLGTQVQNGTKPSAEAKDAVAFIYADELATFLSRQTYNETMVNTIIKLYNAADKDSIDTVGAGEFLLRNICVTLLGTTTPLGLGESVSGRAHSVDFTGRFHFVYSKASGKINPLADVDDEDVDAKTIAFMKETEQRLYEGLLEIRSLHGPIKFTKEGRKWFIDWYNQYRKSPLSEGDGWPGRRPDHLLRLAHLLRVSLDRSLVLDAQVLKDANVLLQRLENNFYLAFQYIGQTNVAKLCDHIIELLRSHGGRLPAATIYNRLYRFFADIDEFKKALALLGEANYVKREQQGAVEYFVLLDPNATL